jgi:hypothetical protein
LRMVTRTFRVNPEYDKILNEEAEKQGLSVSALLNQMIRQYVLVTRFTEKVPAITLSYSTFSPLLNCISDKDLIEVAEKTGATIPEEAMLQRGRTLNLDTVDWFIDVVYGKYGNWFNSTQSINSGRDRIHLAHQLNHKWSAYLGSYMGSMFRAILDVDPKIEIRANSVTIYIPKRSQQKLIFKKSK